MTATNRTDTGDPEVATQQYESLRANALGEINRAPKLTLFLRDGMSAWLRALGDYGHGGRASCRQPSPVFARADADMPGAELVSILTDAILNTAATVEPFGGSR
jgi:hypothetical protein